MEEQWFVDRSKLREVWLDHPEWSKSQLAEVMGRSKAWVKKTTEELLQLTRGALAEMRTLLLELRPAALTQTRLSDLIKQLCEAFIGRSRLPIRLTKELGFAIRSAYEGRMTLSPEATQVLANSVAQPQILGEQLTERERHVLKCMTDGLNNNEIAEALVVSLGTVKFHISNIFHKLGVDSRVEAVKLAIEQRMV